LNSRLATSEKEYLVQTINDQNRMRVLSSVFSEGELIDTQEETLETGIQSEEVLRRVKEAHEERTKELEYLIEMYGEVSRGDQAEQMLYLGQALYYKKMFSESAKLFARASELRPEYHEVWNQLGIVRFALGNRQEACTAFSKCVELKPNYADYRNHLGEAYLALDSCKRAVIEFEEAIRINVYYGEAYLNLALAYILNAILREDFKLFSNQNEKTEEMLKKAEMIMPEISDQEYLEGRKFLERGDLEKAFQRFLLVRERRKDSRRLEFSNSYLKFMLGSSQVNEKLLTRRIKHLKSTIAVNPHFADLHYDLAVAYTLLGSFIHTKAVEEYNKALAINPDYERAKRNLKIAENELKGFDVLIRALIRG
jgi:Flp pilus assembly protein TadD